MEENRQMQYAEDEMSIDWMAILRKILKGWKFILLVTVIFSALGVWSALRMTRTYTVKMTLAPELQNRSSSSLNAIASMLGAGSMMTNSTPDALNITMFPEISESTPFLCSFLEMPVTKYVPRKQELAGVKPDTISLYTHLLGRDRELTEKQKRKMAEADAKYLYDDSTVDPEMLTPRQFSAVNRLRKSINTTFDNKTGVTTIVVTMDDPMIVKQVSDTVCQRLQDFVTEYRTKKAMADYNYYVEMADEAHNRLVRAQSAYAARVDYDRSVILQSVSSARQRLQDEANLANQLYSQMAQQRELAKAKIQEVKPVYAVVQPAYMPNKPSNSRAKVCMIWFFVGFFLSVAWVAFVKDFLKDTIAALKKGDE